MLVLSRSLGESIVIDDQIHVRIVKISGGRVRLAVDAPREVSVDRKEVWARRQFEATTLAEELDPASRVTNNC
jgi:carbon storage regulator